MTSADDGRMRVLVVEDQQRYRDLLVREIQAMGFACIGASSAEQGWEILQKTEVSVVMLDLNLPGMDGMELFSMISENYDSARVIVLTAHGSLDSSVQALRLRAVDYLTKPCSLDEIESALCRIEVDLKARRRAARTEPDCGAQPPAAASKSRSGDVRPLAAVERELILKTLDENDGHKPTTAQQLGISLRTLYNKLKAYDAGGGD